MTTSADPLLRLSALLGLSSSAPKVAITTRCFRPPKNRSELSRFSQNTEHEEHVVLRNAIKRGSDPTVVDIATGSPDGSTPTKSGVD
jgi:hypothetical protein